MKAIAAELNEKYKRVRVNADEEEDQAEAEEEVKEDSKEDNKGEDIGEDKKNGPALRRSYATPEKSKAI